MKSFVLIFCCTLMTLSLFAQKKKKPQDYLITNSNDTIFGKFKKVFMGNLTFVSDDNEFHLDPALYKAYYTKSDGKLYQRVKVGDNDKSKVYWFNCIETGKINLFEQSDYQTLSDGRGLYIRRWIAQKENGPLMEIKSSGPEGITQSGQSNLEYLVRDNPLLFTKVQRAREYSFKKVREIVREYNETTVPVSDSTDTK